MNEVVYSHESLLLQPRQLLKTMANDLRVSGSLAGRLLKRNLQVQYRRSLLGAAWAFIPAAATAVVLTLAEQAKLISVGETPLPYALYVFFGTTLWQGFLEALNAPVQALTAETRLLAKFNVAAEPILLAKLGEAVVNLAVRSLLTAGLFAWYQTPVGFPALLAPFAALALILLGAGLGLLLAPLNALYEDVSKSLPVLTSFWFFLTPVAYPVPEQGALAWLIRYNPVTPLLVTTRELTAALPLSSLAGFYGSLGLACLLLLLGWFAFRVSMPIVLERARF
jgi:lipopolysaccharide transport system permease protein